MRLHPGACCTEEHLVDFGALSLLPVLLPRRPRAWALTPRALRSFLSSASWFPCRLRLRRGRFCSPFHRKENGQWLLPNPHPLLSPSCSHWALRTPSHASTPITHMGLQSQESVHLETGLSIFRAGTEGDSLSQGKAGGKSQLGRWGAVFTCGSGLECAERMAPTSPPAIGGTDAGRSLLSGARDPVGET